MGVIATLWKLALPKSVDGDVEARDNSLRRLTPAVSQVLPDNLGDFEKVHEAEVRGVRLLFQNHVSIFCLLLSQCDCQFCPCLARTQSLNLEALTI